MDTVAFFGIVPVVLFGVLYAAHLRRRFIPATLILAGVAAAATFFGVVGLAYGLGGASLEGNAEPGTKPLGHVVGAALFWGSLLTPSLLLVAGIAVLWRRRRRTD